LPAAFCFLSALLSADEPPAMDPFEQSKEENSWRDDMTQGTLTLSDGKTHSGAIYLSRDKRLKIYDTTAERQREVAWTDVAKIECEVKKEWMEKEWKFKETTSDEKIYTGREYPVREYVCTVTLRDGTTITGTIAAIVFVKTSPNDEPERFLLNKRAKGEPGAKLESLTYVKRIVLEKETMKEKPKEKDDKKENKVDKEEREKA
jgi:hypothetical protein